VIHALVLMLLLTGCAGKRHPAIHVQVISIEEHAAEHDTTAARQLPPKRR
jgi:hypothetical protein